MNQKHSKKKSQVLNKDQLSAVSCQWRPKSDETPRPTSTCDNAIFLRILVVFLHDNLIVVFYLFFLYILQVTSPRTSKSYLILLNMVDKCRAQVHIPRQVQTHTLTFSHTHNSPLHISSDRLPLVCVCFRRLRGWNEGLPPLPFSLSESLPQFKDPLLKEHTHTHAQASHFPRMPQETSIWALVGRCKRRFQSREVACSYCTPAVEIFTCFT